MSYLQQFAPFVLIFAFVGWNQRAARPPARVDGGKWTVESPLPLRLLGPAVTCGLIYLIASRYVTGPVDDLSSIYVFLPFFLFTVPATLILTRYRIRFNEVEVLRPWGPTRTIPRSKVRSVRPGFQG